MQTLSQQYLLTGEAKDLEAAKRGEILFYREPDLPPGVYTMETIVVRRGRAPGQRARFDADGVPRSPPAASA